MSKPEAPEPPPAVVLSVNAIIAGVFYRAGTALPFENENALPESLKPFVATAEAPPPEPAQSNIYDLPLSTRRQVRKLELAAAEKEWAEAQASIPLPEDVQAALEDSHAKHIGRLLKEAEVNAKLTDAAYAAVQPAAAPALREARRRLGKGSKLKTQARRNMLRKARERRNGSRRRRR
jgi:hypothetical protein